MKHDVRQILYAYNFGTTSTSFGTTTQGTGVQIAGTCLVYTFIKPGKCVYLFVYIYYIVLCMYILLQID
jgi:hypothetical protein